MSSKYTNDWIKYKLAIIKGKILLYCYIYHDWEKTNKAWDKEKQLVLSRGIAIIHVNTFWNKYSITQ